MGVLTAQIGELETEGHSEADLNGESRVTKVDEYNHSDVKLGHDGKQQIGHVNTYDNSKFD